MKKNYALKSAFSLMEMMIVLLIVAIIAAATAPMVSKKMLMSATSGDSPWVFANTNGTIAYNMGGKNMSAIIGASSYDANGSSATHPRLVLSVGDTAHPAMVFATGTNGKYLGQINMTDNIVSMQGGTGTVGTNSVAMGMGQTHSSNPRYSVSMGYGTTVKGAGTVAVGAGARASTNNAIAIGSLNSVSATADYSTAAQSSGRNSIAIGTGSKASEEYSISLGAQATGKSSVAIGNNAQATGSNSVAIGQSAKATKNNSVAIGNTEPSADWEIRLGNSDHTVSIPGSLQLNGLTSTSDNGKATYVNYSNNTHELRLGTENDTVYIPGNLVIGGHTVAGVDGGYFAFRWTPIGPVSDADKKFYDRYGVDYKDTIVSLKNGEDSDVDEIVSRLASPGLETLTRKYTTTPFSDRRLKNVGKNFTAGLNELKKLDFYHYTFKNDKDKTPQVGVIAQDLQKVFPDAVTKGHDGYLRIRWDEMFYAVINAVKELDARVTALTQDVKSYFDKTTKLEETVKAQQKTIEELEQRIAKLENK